MKSAEPHRVDLTWYEANMAAEVGIMRQLEAIRSGRPDRHGCAEDDGWRVHIEGAAGEIAVAKYLGRYWDGSVNTYQVGADVGPLQVRTRSLHSYDLIIRPDDGADEIYVLVTGRLPRFVIRGWVLGRDGRKQEWWKSHGNRAAAWFVPQGFLWDMTELEAR